MAAVGKWVTKKFKLDVPFDYQKPLAKQTKAHGFLRPLSVEETLHPEGSCYLYHCDGLYAYPAVGEPYKPGYSLYNHNRLMAVFPDPNYAMATGNERSHPAMALKLIGCTVRWTEDQAREMLKRHDHAKANPPKALGCESDPMTDGSSSSGDTPKQPRIKPGEGVCIKGDDLALGNHEIMDNGKLPTIKCNNDTSPGEDSPLTCAPMVCCDEVPAPKEPVTAPKETTTSDEDMDTAASKDSAVATASGASATDASGSPMETTPAKEDGATEHETKPTSQATGEPGVPVSRKSDMSPEVLSPANKKRRALTPSDLKRAEKRKAIRRRIKEEEVSTEFTKEEYVLDMGEDGSIGC